MNNNWWPKPLSHIPNENPWGDPHVVVAEIRTFDEKPHPGHRTTFSALVPADEVDIVKENLTNIGHEISSSGPHPSLHSEGQYEPEFWIEARELPSGKYEPLVLSWSSHDKTVLMPDPRFLMTYGLAPRNTNDGSVFWDDPAAPLHDVVKVSGPSIWTFPIGTDATVSMSRDYLQDYLTLRNMALVQVYWEIRWKSTDEAIEKKLGDDEAVTLRFTDRQFQLNRSFEDRKIVTTQVWGGRLVALPGELPITENALETEGLQWPGFAEPVTDAMADSMNMTDRVYVDDAVLGDFEGKSGFRVNPKTGSVTFGTQWGVGFCERVGRNFIRLELKKLYEGVPPHITRRWNKFAVDPIPRQALPDAIRARNIGVRAEEITFAVVKLGEELAALSKLVGLTDFTPESFVGLRRSALEYSGWWTFEGIEPIARHIPKNCSMDFLLDRCVSLSKLAIEGLDEGKIRRLLLAFGVPADAIENYRSLKLLDCVIRLIQVAHATGLRISTHGSQLWTRLIEHGTSPAQPLTHLFALYDIRILKSHKADGIARKLMEELQRFDVKPEAAAAGYGEILDAVYDVLIAELLEATKKIHAGG